MKKYNITETIRLFIMQAQTKKAIDELYLFCTQNGFVDLIDKVILLSSSFSDIKNSEILGLGQYVEEKNRINLALLKIIEKLDKQLSNQNKIISTTKENNSKLDLIESKLDFLLNHIEVNDDIYFHSFNNSKLWKLLESSSRDDIINAHIIEKEAKQDFFAEAIRLYLNTVKNELNYKFFSRFKLLVNNEEFDKKIVFQDFNGNSKDKILKYLEDDYSLSLNLMLRIILENVLTVDKDNLKGLALEFYMCFHSVYKIKNKSELIEFIDFYVKYKVKSIKVFSQTLIDVVRTKEDIIGFYLNLQPRMNNVSNNT